MPQFHKEQIFGNVITSAKLRAFPNFKVAIFYMVIAVALELQFARISYVWKYTAIWPCESDEFFEGSVQTLILAICILFFELFFWNIDAHELLFQAGIFSK